jgi:hypothetical protein
MRSGYLRAKHDYRVLKEVLYVCSKWIEKVDVRVAENVWVTLRDVAQICYKHHR